MNSNKIPIWERQGRPKPPNLADSEGIISDKYSDTYLRWRVCSYYQKFLAKYMVLRPNDTKFDDLDFDTFQDAIAYADRKARE